jgi:hypothetical protein
MTTPVGAAVTVKGRAIGSTPVDITGPIDTLISVHLELPGYQPRSEDVVPTAEGGEAVFSLQRSGATRHSKSSPSQATPKIEKTQPGEDGIFD